MTISEMIAKLQEMQAKHGDIDVLFNENNGDLRAVEYACVHITEEDEFPPSWNMPSGYTFVEIGQI